MDSKNDKCHNLEIIGHDDDASLIGQKSFWELKNTGEFNKCEANIKWNYVAKKESIEPTVTCVYNALLVISSKSTQSKYLFDRKSSVTMITECGCEPIEPTYTSIECIESNSAPSFDGCIPPFGYSAFIVTARFDRHNSNKLKAKFITKLGFSDTQYGVLTDTVIYESYKFESVVVWTSELATLHTDVDLTTGKYRDFSTNIGTNGSESISSTVDRFTCITPLKDMLYTNTVSLSSFNDIVVLRLIIDYCDKQLVVSWDFINVTDLLTYATYTVAVGCPELPPSVRTSPSAQDFASDRNGILTKTWSSLGNKIEYTGENGITVSFTDLNAVISNLKLILSDSGEEIQISLSNPDLTSSESAMGALLWFTLSIEYLGIRDKIVGEVLISGPRNAKNIPPTPIGKPEEPAGTKDALEEMYEAEITYGELQKVLSAIILGDQQDELRNKLGGKGFFDNIKATMSNFVNLALSLLT